MNQTLSIFCESVLKVSKLSSITVDNVDAAIDMYNEVLALRRKGYSVNKALVTLNKARPTLKRVEHIAALKILRPIMYDAVSIFFMQSIHAFFLL